jgi:hypothetical protein
MSLNPQLHTSNEDYCLGYQHWFSDLNNELLRNGEVG